MSDDTTWLKFIISEIAEVAPWEDRSPDHAAAHVRNLILNLRADANVERAELKEVKAELARMKARPVEVEYTRLDAMWQQLVRERDEAVRALSELRSMKQELPAFDADDLQIDVCYGRGSMGPTPRRPHAVRVTHVPTGKQATGYHDHFVSAAKDQAMQQLSATLKEE
jgi:hypothetical protein